VWPGKHQHSESHCREATQQDRPPLSQKQPDSVCRIVCHTASPINLGRGVPRADGKLRDSFGSKRPRSHQQLSYLYLRRPVGVSAPAAALLPRPRMAPAVAPPAAPTPTFRDRLCLELLRLFFALGVWLWDVVAITGTAVPASSPADRSAANSGSRATADPKGLIRLPLGVFDRTGGSLPFFAEAPGAAETHSVALWSRATSQPTSRRRVMG
jgi:hypothetical protein